MYTGIYQIRNLLDNKIYIGSAQITFTRRKTQHWSDLRKDKHHSIHLQRAVNKYGIENFVFEVLEECLPENCIEREQYYIDTLKPQYNIRVTAKSNRGIKKTPEQIERIIEARKNCNWKITEEGRKAISDRHKGVPKTKEHAEKVGAASKKKILQYDLEGNFIKEWDSIKNAEDYFNCRKGSIWRVLSKQEHHKSCKGYIWKYFQENYPVNIDIEEYKHKKSTHLCKNVLQFNLNKEFIREWSSISEAARYYNRSPDSILQCLQERSKSSAGFIWKYKN